MFRVVQRHIRRSVAGSLNTAPKCSCPREESIARTFKPSNQLPVTAIGFHIQSAGPLPHQCIITSRNYSTEIGGSVGEWTDNGAFEESEELDFDPTTRQFSVDEEREMNKEWQSKQIVIKGLAEVAKEDEDLLRKRIMNLLEKVDVRKNGMDIVEIQRYQSGHIGCLFAEWYMAKIVLNCVRRNRHFLPPGVHIEPLQIFPYKNISYHLRVLVREGKIQQEGKRGGTPVMKLLGSDEWMVVYHMQDLVDLGLL